MFRLLSDPREGWPPSEVDLRLAVSPENLAVIASGGVDDRDLKLPRPDGGDNFVFRPQRRTVPLVFDYLDAAQFERLLELRARHVPIFAFPDFGPETILYAPLQRDLVCLAKSAATDLLVVSAGTFDRDSVAWSTDDFERFTSHAADVPRFIRGQFGRGIFQDNGRANLASNKHPANGSLGWAAVGAPALAPVWNTSIPSPVLSKGGVAELPYDNHATTPAAWSQSWSAGSASAGRPIVVSLWLKGDQRVFLVCTLNAADSASSPIVQLSAHRWTRVSVRVAPKVAAGNAIALTLVTATAPASKGKLFAAPLFVYESSAGIDEAAPAGLWHETGSPDTETMQFPCLLHSGTFSIGWTGICPGRIGATSSPDLSRCWRIDGADAGVVPRAAFQVSGSNQVLRAWVAAAETLEVTIPSSAAGRPYVASLVLDTASNPQRARLLVTIDGVRYEDAQSGSAAFVASRFAGTILEVGNPSTSSDSFSGFQAIAHVRVDQKAWTVAEQNIRHRMLAEDAFRQILALTSGVLFSIGAPDVAPRADKWNQLVGRVPLSEVDRIDSFLVATV